MSSRTEQKRRLRQERLERERVQALEARRNRRLKLLGTVLVGALVVVGIAIAVSNTGSGTKHASTTGKVAEADAVAARFKGIPQKGLVLGNPKAPVTFVQFEDLKCPVCQAYTKSVFPTLVNKYVRTGKVKMQLELQHFVGNQNGDSEAAARMALAAGKQNKLWNFADLFYYNQQDESTTYVTDPFLRRIGGAVPGLDVDKAMAARNGNDITSGLAQASNEFDTAGFDGTPSFAIGKTGGTLSPLNPGSFTDTGPYTSAIDKELGSSAG
jgi:protein-disulfide isomerase